MNDDASDMPCSGGCGASSKWAQTVTAIRSLVGETEMTVNWGLELFPDSGTACAVAGSVTVPVGPAHARPSRAAIGARTSPNGGVIAGGNAPIRDAENIAAAYLAGLTDAGRKFILLATAGAPSCLPGGSDPARGDAAGAVQAITNAQERGFSDHRPRHRDGRRDGRDDPRRDGHRGRPSRTGSPCYTPVANVAELTSGLHTLLGINPPCIFAAPAGRRRPHEPFDASE